jgi:hypothetical protein
MKNCWNSERKERPTFSKLAEMMENYIKSNNSLDYLNWTGKETEIVKY